MHLDSVDSEALETHSLALPGPQLTAEQLVILHSATNGESIFFTGGAGTGKTFLLQAIIKRLRIKYSEDDAVAVTSPTGIAASNIGGMTIHSFSGAGLALEPAEVLAEIVLYNAKALARWLRVKVLVIDEVSMLEGALFDKLAIMAGILRNSEKPFGVTGDCYQLPPVAKSNAVKFAFEAKAWDTTITKKFYLDTVFRQRDKEFVDMLNEVRFGDLSPRTIARFRSLSRSLTPRDGVEPTELFPRRQDVERSNLYRLGQLNTPLFEYVCVDGGSIRESLQREKLLASVMAPKVLHLRVGAQVMLVRNMDDELVNGSVGYVTSFVTSSADKDELPLSDDNIKSTVQYPRVLFRLCNGRTREIVVSPVCFTVETAAGEVRASRTQIPLILAWALSIHKAQGQTLELVKVDLKKVFETGQVYVALSRATSLDGLQILNFNPALVRAHPRVVQWDATRG